MKRFLSLLICFLLIISTVPVFASDVVTVFLDGTIVTCKDVNGNSIPPILIDGTTYLPVRAIANALQLDIEWNDETKSVFINGTPDKSEKGDNVNIYVNGLLFTAKDVNGKVVNPILKDGTTYLPVRAIGEAFNKRVNWEQETKTVTLSTPKLSTFFSEDEVYVILNKASEKAISVTESGLRLEPWVAYDYQLFKFIPSDTEGYYFIQSVSNGKNFDVNGNSKNPGAKIITYNPGNADNQKFAIEKYGEGHNDYIIYALSSKLPIEDSIGTLKQNTLRESDVQRWEILLCKNVVPPTEENSQTICHTLTSDDFTLSDNNCSAWIFTPNEDGEYIITNKETQKSLDVANNSKTSGDPIITYKTSGDPNQRWTLKKKSDGTYLIKSVHSGLYLSVNNGTLCHAELSESFKQSWSIATVLE